MSIGCGHQYRYVDIEDFKSLSRNLGVPLSIILNLLFVKNTFKNYHNYDIRVFFFVLRQCMR